jgi:hypothetical protein
MILLCATLRCEQRLFFALTDVLSALIRQLHDEILKHLIAIALVNINYDGAI